MDIDLGFAKNTKDKFVNTPPPKILKHAIPPHKSGCKMNQMVSRLSFNLYKLWSFENG
jgi:hypothetical protein